MKFFHQHLVDHARICLPLGGLHNLTNQEAEGLFLSGLEVGNGLKLSPEIYAPVPGILLNTILRWFASFPMIGS